MAMRRKVFPGKQNGTAFLEAGNFGVNGGMNDEDESHMAQGRYSIRCDG